MRKLIILLLFLPLFLFSTGLIVNPDNIKFTSNSINGQVIDQNTNETLAGATIELYLNDKIIERVYTDLEGNFKFDIENDKKYEMKIIYISYKTKSFSVENEKIITMEN